MAPAGDFGAPVTPELRVTSPARTGDVTKVRHKLTRWIAAHHPPADLVGDIALAAYEALINTAEHAYPAGAAGDVELRAQHQPGLIRITVTDFGRWDHPPAAPDPSRGRGLALIRILSDDATIVRTGSGTTVTMTWRLHPDGT
ncbi:ATP-binding protein [Amycolatopsis sp. NPDC049253]|uniref:ATP-binding protein n=1 Tax=Amycolatopsis sp. NPDC049253 TaxID=3155274 RepID=UPI003440FDAA